MAVGERSMWLGAAGYADIAKKRPVGPRTIFALASMSKAYVSALATQLIAERAFTEGDQLSRWVPELRGAGDVTVLDLLTGSSGITDDNEHPFVEADGDPDHHFTDADFLRRIPPAVCPPGTCRSGSGENAPYVLLGMIIERATGSSLATLYRERFYRPLGLRDTFLQAEERSHGEIAVGYRESGSDRFQAAEGLPGPLTTAWATSAGGAAASMAASARDVAVWTRGVFFARVIGKDALRTITDVSRYRASPGSFECSPAAIAFGAGEFDGREVRRANGGIPGFRSALSYFPKEDVAVVALTNSKPDAHDASAIEAVRDEIARVVLATSRSTSDQDAPCNVDLYSVRSDGSDVRRLTADPKVDASLADWSRDGRRILFGSNRTGDFDLYVMASDGTAQTDLTRDPGSDDGGAWSPDSGRIAFSSDRDGDHEIFVMRADGTNVRQVTRNRVEDSAPSWSPDGSLLAFVRGTNDGPSDIYVMRPDGSGLRRVTTGDKVNLWPPSWSPDGTRLAYGEGDPRYPYRQRILTTSLDGSNHVPVVSDPAGDSQPSWGPDERIAFASNGDIFVIRPDGSGRSRITSGWSQDGAPAWSPDGRSIVFASERKERGPGRTRDPV